MQGYQALNQECWHQFAYHSACGKKYTMSTGKKASLMHHELLWSANITSAAWCMFQFIMKIIIIIIV